MHWVMRCTSERCKTLANEPGREQFELPELGQHSREILRAVGYSDDEIAKLVRQGTIK